MPSQTSVTTPPASTSVQAPVLKVKTHIKAGLTMRGANHNETLVRVQKLTQGLKVKTNIKAGSNSSRIYQSIN